jgi:ElaB/YqjD/DUF883 family membrane-anchored ribosome-binding protein
MDAELLRECWENEQQSLRARWHRLSAEDIAAIGGDAEALLATLERVYGWSRERATREAEAWLDSCVQPMDAGEPAPNVFVRSAKANLGPGARKVREGLEELREGVREFAKESAERAREAANDRGERIAESAQAARERVSETASDLGEQAKSALEHAERFVRERPFTALGIAFAVGYLISRRR